MRRLPIPNCRLPIREVPSRWLGPARPSAWRAAFLFGFSVLAFFTGCGDGGAKKSEPDAASRAVSRTATDGPVTLTFTVTPADLPYTDRADVLVEVVADKDHLVEIEEYDRVPAHLEHPYEYRLTRGPRRSATPTPDGKLIWSYRYDLQLFLPGDFELPAAGVAFTEALSSDSSGTVQTENRKLKTDAITVHARDPNAKAMTAEELRKITALPPVELPGAWGRGWWVGALVLLAIALFIWRILRRTRGAIVEIPLPPDEWARRQLALLVADELVARGRLQEFYYRVSDVVRGYVERRFAVSAPEMTTEEFLVAAAADGRFGPQNTAELREFLTACDWVKYARQIPRAAEADQVFQAAGAFVERTTADALNSEIETRPQRLQETHAA